MQCAQREDKLSTGLQMDLPDKDIAGSSGSDHGGGQASSAKRKRRGGGCQDWEDIDDTEVTYQLTELPPRGADAKEVKKYKDAYDKRGTRLDCFNKPVMFFSHCHSWLARPDCAGIIYISRIPPHMVSNSWLDMQLSFMGYTTTYDDTLCMLCCAETTEAAAHAVPAWRGH